MALLMLNLWIHSDHQGLGNGEDNKDVDDAFGDNDVDVDIDDHFQSNHRSKVSKMKWKHDIKPFQIRWERRELQETIAKQTDNPKKLLKFEKEANEELKEEQKAIFYGRNNNDINYKQPLMEDTLIEVSQIEGGSIPAYVYSNKPSSSFWP
eukprot:CAMPEP_0114362696 /NCGR_PEP_ID=MMETSP0101-20121206/25882_1 /TAXON_ID=38822 ORGANISM="Pteridomonas danica, Strain PT" /NCGR_SAMPLE_ID=MMETSP0101 /ASSEMBLY_ACC=CAM_ASM_000211 /LENGTH=150 /DNA_ID=CAMNT_0001508711 /DNA_START=213 /DNA_END=662 /DNA_ORIENTATION=+